MTAFRPSFQLLGLALISFALLPSAALAGTFFQLTSQPGIDRHPAWTPDGSTIIYESNGGSSNLNLWKVSATGGTPTQLTALAGDERMPEVSPDGTTIAFTRMNIDPSATEQATIWTMPIGGGPPTQISTPNDFNDLDWHSSWTPDGSEIYFSRRLGNDNPNWNIYRVSSTGGPVSLVYSAPGIQNRPHVSHDGNHLIFENDFNGPALNAIRAPIGNPASQTQLTFFTRNTSTNDWSPADDKILYSTRQNLNRFELWELDLATLTSTQLTFDVPVEPFDPNNVDATYSPDGQRIAFTSRRQTGNDNIWILDRNEPIAVVLSRFEASATQVGVQVEWEAAQDGVHSHFNLYRSTADSGPWALVNDRPIRGDGSYRHVDSGAESGSRWFYELEAVDRQGRAEIVGQLSFDFARPSSRLHLAGFPNPTRLGSTIRVFVPGPSEVRLDVFDVSGRLVRVLEPGKVLDQGWHDYAWDGTTDQGVPSTSGVYHVRAGSAEGESTLLRLIRTN